MYNIPLYVTYVFEKSSCIFKLHIYIFQDTDATDEEVENANDSSRPIFVLKGTCISRVLIFFFTSCL